MRFTVEEIRIGQEVGEIFCYTQRVNFLLLLKNLLINDKLILLQIINNVIVRIKSTRGNLRLNAFKPENLLFYSIPAFVQAPGEKSPTVKLPR